MHAQRPTPLNRDQIDHRELTQDSEIRGVRRAINHHPQTRKRDPQERTSVRVRLPELERAKTELEPASLRIALDESTRLKRPQKPKQDRLMQPQFALEQSEAHRRSLDSKRLQHRQRPIDGLHMVTPVLCRIAGYRFHFGAASV